MNKKELLRICCRPVIRCSSAGTKGSLLEACVSIVRLKATIPKRIKKLYDICLGTIEGTSGMSEAEHFGSETPDRTNNNSNSCQKQGIAELLQTHAHAIIELLCLDLGVGTPFCFSIGSDRRIKSLVTAAT